MTHHRHQQSDKGKPYSHFILAMGFAMIVVILFLAIINPNAKDSAEPLWPFILLMAGQILFFAIVLAVIFPNTKTVELISDDILVRANSKSERIPITSIQKIEASTTYLFTGAWGEFYRVQFHRETVFGEVIYFKVNTTDGNTFAQDLKAYWARARKAAM